MSFFFLDITVHFIFQKPEKVLSNMKNGVYWIGLHRPFWSPGSAQAGHIYSGKEPDRGIARVEHILSLL